MNATPVGRSVLDEDLTADHFLNSRADMIAPNYSSTDEANKHPTQSPLPGFLSAQNASRNRAKCCQAKNNHSGKIGIHVTFRSI